MVTPSLLLVLVCSSASSPFGESRLGRTLGVILGGGGETQSCELLETGFACRRKKHLCLLTRYNVLNFCSQQTFKCCTFDKVFNVIDCVISLVTSLLYVPGHAFLFLSRCSGYTVVV